MIHVAVIAHGGAQETFDRHLRFWEAVNPRPVIYCPEDDPVKTTHECALVGHRGRATIDSIVRLCTILRRFVNTSLAEDCLVIFEYDSICLDPTKLRHNGDTIDGNAMASLDERFIAPRYLNPPWIIGRSAAETIIVATASRYPFIFEKGEVDRWLSAMAHLANIPMLDYEPCGFSRGTIGHEHLTELRVAIYQGATMIHGIKHEVILNEALKYYEEMRRL